MTLIKSWEELIGLESEEYYLDIDLDGCCGYIRSKSDDDYYEYLSTHTFYGSQYEYATATLQSKGFDIQLDNWDGKTEEVNYRNQWLYWGDCKKCRRNKYCTVKCKAAKR